jgi:hypothetical protein
MKLPVSFKYISLLATALVLTALYTVGCVSFPNLDHCGWASTLSETMRF